MTSPSRHLTAAAQRLGLDVAEFAEQVASVVGTAPPLNGEARDRLAVLLRGTTQDVGSRPAAA